jgi:hypothetical protein
LRPTCCSLPPCTACGAKRAACATTVSTAPSCTSRSRYRHTTAYAEADHTTWRGDALGLTGCANDRHGSGVTLGLMQKF